MIAIYSQSLLHRDRLSINSDRFSNNHITRRSLFAKSKTAAIALNDVKPMLSL